MKIKDTFPILEEMAPLGYAESYDNVGLLVGDANLNLTGILVCHDALEIVIDEAVANNCNLVLCFHPILFEGLRRITGKNYVEKALIKAIKNDVAIYAVHTALDNHADGVSKILCDALGIKKSKVLVPKQHYIQKLVTFT
ncbi:MAG TPA: Nif3-like dinuclear metal center hexameric protein, partial [Flavobacterium sp.]|nr:Nif3-like dinuclear metal center hexameric protein [Flavobacterium sp.]